MLVVRGCLPSWVTPAGGRKVETLSNKEVRRLRVIPTWLPFRPRTPPRHLVVNTHREQKHSLSQLRRGFCVIHLSRRSPARPHLSSCPGPTKYDRPEWPTHPNEAYSQNQQVTRVDKDGSLFSTRFVETQLCKSKL